MNGMKFLVTAAVALSCVSSVFAEEESQTFRDETVGWTPIALGLATPVQLPWGTGAWDVYGLDLNVFYSDAPTMCGLQVAGLANFNRAPVYGVRATLGANVTPYTVYGCDLGMVAARDAFYGFDANFLGSMTRTVYGVQAAGLMNMVEKEMHGVQLAGIANLSKKAHGLQVAFVYNMTEELHGCQIGFVNFADYCPNGFQIGLVNIILSNQVKVLPFVNGYF